MGRLRRRAIISAAIALGGSLALIALAEPPGPGGGGCCWDTKSSSCCTATWFVECGNPQSGAWRCTQTKTQGDARTVNYTIEVPTGGRSSQTTVQDGQCRYKRRTCGPMPGECVDAGEQTFYCESTYASGAPC